MSKSIMDYELEARGWQGMENKINELNALLQAMQSDFAQCARGKSPCFFCEHDETCECTNDSDCNFKWQRHN